MASIATDTADDVGSEVALFRAVVFAMADLTTCYLSESLALDIEAYQLTVLASLIFIVTESTVESGELTELVTLELVLTFRNRSGLTSLISMKSRRWDRIATHRLNYVVHQLLGLVHLFFGVCHDQTVEILFLVACVSGVRAAFALLDGAFATNGNLGTRLGLHFLQGVSTRSYK